MTSKIFKMVAAAVLALSGISCAGVIDGDDSSGGTGTLTRGTGRLSIELVDAPLPEVKEIVVSIDKITAHLPGKGWVTVTDENLTVDLLTLQTKSHFLGSVVLPAGEINQLRLYLVEGAPQYVTLPDGSKVDLKVPSGVQSGIKIKGKFSVGSCETTIATLDFDGKKSIWVHPTGQGDLWILRPVIHAKRVETQSEQCQEPGDGSGSPDAGRDWPGDGSGRPGDGDGSDPTDPTDPSDPTDPTNPGEPTDPTDPTDPTNPGDGTTDGGSGFKDGSGRPGSPSGAGDPCTDSSVCLSGSCIAGQCDQSGPGEPCFDAADCVSGNCQADGICANGDSGGYSAPCSTNSQCLSNTCEAGACEPGAQGSPCVVEADCASSLNCRAGFCYPPVN